MRIALLGLSAFLFLACGELVGRISSPLEPTVPDVPDNSVSIRVSGASTAVTGEECDELLHVTGLTATAITDENSVLILGSVKNCGPIALENVFVIGTVFSSSGTGTNKTLVAEGNGKYYVGISFGLDYFMPPGHISAFGMVIDMFSPSTRLDSATLEFFMPPTRSPEEIPHTE